MTKVDQVAQRKRLIKLIHVARRELQIQDDDYRAMLANMQGLEGATSSAQLSIPKLTLVLEALKKKGFKIVPKSPKPAMTLADDPQSRLIRHLWLTLYKEGRVRDSSESALTSYVRRVTGIEQLQWLDRRQASRVIESLKSWGNR